MDRLDAFRRHLKTYFFRTAFVILPRFGGLTDGAKEPLDFLCHHCASVYVIIIIIFLSSIMTCTVSFSNTRTGYF